MCELTDQDPGPWRLTIGLSRLNCISEIWNFQTHFRLEAKSLGSVDPSKQACALLWIMHWVYQKDEISGIPSPRLAEDIHPVLGHDLIFRAPSVRFRAQSLGMQGPQSLAGSLAKGIGHINWPGDELALGAQRGPPPGSGPPAQEERSQRGRHQGAQKGAGEICHRNNTYVGDAGETWLKLV